MDRYEQTGSSFTSTTNSEELNEDSVFGLPVEFHLDDQIVAESAEYWAPHYLHKDGTLSPELIRIITHLNAEQNQCTGQVEQQRRHDASPAPPTPSKKRRQSKSSSSGTRAVRRSRCEDQQQNEMNEEQKAELVVQLVQLIKEQTKELEENKNSCAASSNTSNERLNSARPKSNVCCAVPPGWQRKTVGPSGVVYISPSGDVLDSLCSVNEYLMNAGTCKCGIDCPIKVDQVFNFDPLVAASAARPAKSCCCLVSNRPLPPMPLTKRSRGRPRKSDRITSELTSSAVSDHQSKLERSISDILRQSSMCPPKSSKKRSGGDSTKSTSPMKTPGRQAEKPTFVLDCDGKDVEREALRQLFAFYGSRRQDDDASKVPTDPAKIKRYLDQEFLPNVKLLQNGGDIREFAKHLIFTSPCDSKNSFDFDFVKTKNRSRKTCQRNGEQPRNNARSPRAPVKKEKPSTLVETAVPSNSHGDDDCSRQSITENTHMADNLFELFNDLSDSLPLFEDSGSLFAERPLPPLEENWPGCRL